MKLLVTNIPEEGQTLLLSPKVEWVCNLVRHALSKENPVLDSISGEIQLLRVNQYINVRGNLAVDLMAHCDRCLKGFRYSFAADLKLNLSPLYHSSKERDKSQQKDEEIELTTEDMEFSFYDGKEIDLSPLLTEGIVLSLPNQYLCIPACQGLCQNCGANLNDKKCVCKRKVTIDPRWEALKKISGKSR